ncbi:MAG: alpha-glucosidase C-terminal domain-containing protein [Anaerolineae bacterium]|nr:alpha-glucosidase C-terminal domain-containing protein [Anaerolineae bacterium]
MWWKKSVIYQIYPRSFQDSDGDGVGDLAGVMQRLDYLRWLGVDAIWLSPIFPSPLADFGYDVADYTAIDPVFGTLADFDALVDAAHERDIRVLLDLVLNHSSDQHAWFQDSRASRDNPRRNWYIWRDPAPAGGPPNNWMSYFGGPAWTLDETTGQYYLHSFLKEQPDLNWRSPGLRAAMFDAVRFWLERGVDGFRLDAVHCVGKHPDLPDEPPNPDYQPGEDSQKRMTHNIHSVDGPLVHEVLRALRTVLDEYPDTYTIGEVPSSVGYANLFQYAAPDELDMVFDFFPMRAPLTAAGQAAAIAEWEASAPGHIWPGVVYGNHDLSRVARRESPALARLAALLLLTRRGTPYIYAGDEIGMAGMDIPPEQQQDPAGQRGGWNRDDARTPLQWDDGPNAGFTTGEPWLPIAPDYRRVNVTAQRGDTTSMLSLYRWLLRYRRGAPALRFGSFRVVETGNPDVYAYLREADSHLVLVVLNFSAADQEVELAEMGEGQVILSTNLDRAERISLAHLFLRGHEGVLIEVV